MINEHRFSVRLDTFNPQNPKPLNPYSIQSFRNLCGRSWEKTAAHIVPLLPALPWHLPHWELQFRNFTIYRFILQPKLRRRICVSKSSECIPQSAKSPEALNPKPLRDEWWKPLDENENLDENRHIVTKLGRTFITVVGTLLIWP